MGILFKLYIKIFIEVVVGQQIYNQLSRPTTNSMKTKMVILCAKDVEEIYGGLLDKYGDSPI